MTDACPSKASLEAGGLYGATDEYAAVAAGMCEKYIVAKGSTIVPRLSAIADSRPVPGASRSPTPRTSRKSTTAGTTFAQKLRAQIARSPAWLIWWIGRSTSQKGRE